jgi:hypothetical protein
MKKLLMLVLVLFLVGCSPAAAPPQEAAPAQPDTAADQPAVDTSDKDAQIAVLEYQIEDLNQELATLQTEYDALLAASGGDAEAPVGGFMCENPPASIRYDTPVGTIAIIEGWFATQPYVQSMEGTYSTQFWTGVNSRVHTIRYTSAEDGLSTTANFMIMFEEAGWQPGVLYMTDSCWLDYPY